MPPGTVAVSWCGTDSDVEACPPWMDVFVEHVLDRGVRVVFDEPVYMEGAPSKELAETVRPGRHAVAGSAGQGRPPADAPTRPPLLDPPRVAGERDAYRV